MVVNLYGLHGHKLTVEHLVKAFTESYMRHDLGIFLVTYDIEPSMIECYAPELN